MPVGPKLEPYKKQAKDLVKAYKSGDPEALRRVQQYPRRRKLPEPESAAFTPTDARYVIASEHGFNSWHHLSQHLEGLDQSPASLWKAAQKAVITGSLPALELLLHNYQEFFDSKLPPPYVPSGPGPEYARSDARDIIAREHHFENFDEFAAHRAALKLKDSAVSRFEAAVEAMIAGELSALARLLGADSGLIRARSTRKHHATLLHYVGANGIEGFRQKTPKNAVKVAEMLLRAGAEVDAVAAVYGGSTTLGLVATSIHPLLAGVQNALMTTLLDYGASIDYPRAAGNGHLAVNGCLANGRPEAALFLAQRGARLDLEGAAGLGRLDLVK